MEINPRSMVAGGLVAAGVASAAAGWFWWGPSRVVEQIEAAAAARGLNVIVGDVDLGWSRVDVEDLRVDGENLHAELPNVRVHGGLWDMSRRGREAVERVDIVEGEVRYTGTVEEAPQEDQSDETSAALEGAEATDVGEATDVAEATDVTEPEREDGEHEEDGDAVNEEAAEPEAAATHGAPDAAGVQTVVVADSTDALAATTSEDDGPSSWPSVHLDGVRVVVADATGDLAEASVSGSLESGELTLSADNSRIGEAPGNAARVERGELLAVHGDAGWVVHRALGAGVAVTLGSEDRATRNRIDAMLRSRATDDENDEDDGSEDSDDPFARFAVDAEIEIESARVVRGDDEVVLESFRAKAQRNEDGIAFEGHGSGEGGEATWDLVVDPSVPSARGSLEVDSLALDLLLPLLPEIPWSHPELARVAANLEVEASADGDVSMVGTMSLSDAALEHERIAPRAIQDIGFEVTGRATLNLPQGRLAIPEAELRVRNASLNFTATAEKNPEFWSLEFDARLPPTECNDAVGAIPTDLLAETAGFSWSGRMSGNTHLKVDSRNFRELELDINVSDQCQFQTVPAAADIRRVQGAFLHRVVEPEGGAYEMMAGPGSANWVPIAAISPFLIQSVIGHEDGGFFGHSGFAVYAIRDALSRNLREGRYVVGASTITMQLTKNLFLHREKTLARKVQEVLLTWWVETALSKEEILELYLNVIEYGPRVYGVVQASDHYFGRRPVELTAAESAFFATILPNPKRYHDAFVRGTLSSSMRSKVSRFLRHLRSRNRIDDVALADAMAQLEVFRFNRGTGAGAQWQAAGEAGRLPFATSSVGTGPVGEDPEADPYEEEYVTGDEWL